MTVSRDEPAPDDADHAWITRAAFVLALVLTAARALAMHALRDVTPVAPPLTPPAPGTSAAIPPRALLAGTSILLDAACLVPAVLVLARVAVDDAFRLARAWSLVPLAVLAAWAMTSAAWASDSWSAAAGASTWLAAAALVFTFANTVRTASRLRVCAAVAAALLAGNVTQGTLYRLFDLPLLIETFDRDRDRILAERGWEADSFAARQFEHRLRQGQTGAYTASPNSFAAALVLLGITAAGLAWQKIRDRHDPLTWAVVLVPLPVAAWLLWTTGSRTALATAVLAAGLLAGWRTLGAVAARFRVPTFAAGVAGVVAVVAGVVAVGVTTGELVHVSMTFRWHYWVGAAGVFAESPLTGAGFGNFGNAYLAHRLPVAAEEVSDPHNLLVRFFAETGLIGGGLAVAWLALLAWELTRPHPPRLPASPAVVAMKPILALAAAMFAVNLVIVVDFTQDPDALMLEIVRRAMIWGTAAAVLLFGVIRSREPAEGDDRPAPVGAAAMSVGAGVVLVHSMVDVVVFEPSVLMTAVLVIGAAIGIRASQTAPPPPRVVAWSGVGVAALAWLTFVAAYAVPTWLAERTALDADDLVRRGRFVEAARTYERSRGPFTDAEVLGRRAYALLLARRTDQAERVYGQAIAADPRQPRWPLLRARVRAEAGRLDEAIGDVRSAVTLDPNETAHRLRLAELLTRAGRDAEAREQIEKALWLNDQLRPDEPQRLPAAEVERLRGRLAE